MILYHTASNDFSSEPLSITIPSNAIVGQYYCFNLQSILFDDDIIEDTESFIVTIQETYPSITIEPGVTTVYITDNDGACGLSSFQYRLVTTHVYSFEDNGSSLGGGTEELYQAESTLQTRSLGLYIYMQEQLGVCMHHRHAWGIIQQL